MQLRFAEAHREISLEEKVGVACVKGAARNLGLPFNISATAEVIDFKFGTQLGFAKAHHNITPRGKFGMALS